MKQQSNIPIRREGRDEEIALRLLLSGPDPSESFAQPQSVLMDNPDRRTNRNISSGSLLALLLSLVLIVLPFLAFNAQKCSLQALPTTGLVSLSSIDDIFIAENIVIGISSTATCLRPFRLGSLI